MYGDKSEYFVLPVFLACSNGFTNVSTIDICKAG